MSKETVSVIGLGFVGFPMACILANKNFKVIGIDKNINQIRQDKIEIFKQSSGLYEDKELNKICNKAIREDRIYFTNNIKKIEKSKIIIVCINFDFKKNKLSQLKKLKNFFSNLAKFMKKKSMILIETTLPPGTCDKIIIPTIKKSLSKRKIKISDIFFSYAFERVMPGKFYLKSITENYKCYAGKDKISGERCKKFLQKYLLIKI